MTEEQDGLTAEELRVARLMVRTLIDGLCGQPGSHEVARVVGPHGAAPINASTVRRLRYTLYRPSPELAAMNEALRRGSPCKVMRANRDALRAVEFAEPCV